MGVMIVLEGYRDGGVVEGVGVNLGVRLYCEDLLLLESNILNIRISIMCSCRDYNYT